MSLETVTDIVPERSQLETRRWPHRDRRRKVAQIDTQTAAGRRIRELRKLYETEMAAAGIKLSVLRKVQVDTAAAATVVAETARRRYLEEGVGKLSDLVAAERHAAQALKRLGLLSVDRPSSRHEDGSDALRNHIAARYRKPEAVR